MASMQSNSALALALCFAMSASMCSAQALVIVDDLPSLSTTVDVSTCSSGRYVTVTDKYMLSYTDNDSVSWIRAKISIRGKKPIVSWQIKILGPNDEDVQTIEGLAAFASSDTIWTQLVAGSRLTLNLRSSGTIDGLQVCLDSVNVPRFEPGVKSIIHNHDDREDLVQNYGTGSRYYEFSKPIALIRFLKQISGKSIESSCTGFLITPTLLLTNNHCIDSPQQVSTTSITFDYETGHTNPIPIGPRSLSYTNKALDFTLLRIDETGHPIAKISLAAVQQRQPMILIQHPMAEPKMIAVKKCQIQDVHAVGRPTDFFHLCDSSAGSSGSPVMDQRTGIAYGLHHLGATDPADKDYHNLAVYFGEIIGDIKVHEPMIYSEILAAQNLSRQ
jgi:hypothetical protein